MRLGRLRYTISFLVLIAAIVVAYFAIHAVAPPQSGPDLARAKASAKGLYEVSFEPNSQPLKLNTINTWTLTIKTKDGKPVDGAAVTVAGGMPAHGRGMPTSPAVKKDGGEGVYEVDGVEFSMAGWWQFKFTIKTPQGSDQAVFNVIL